MKSFRGVLVRLWVAAYLSHDPVAYALAAGVAEVVDRARRWWRR